MISSASLLLLLAASAPPDTGVAAALAGRVAELVAERWQVAPAEVTLEWGRLPAMADSASGPVRLVGGARDGWFVVTLTPSDGRPRAARVRAGVWRDAVVAARDLPAGHTLTADDLRVEARVVWGPPDPDAAPVGPGWDVRRSVTAGTVLLPPIVQPALVVAPGDVVTFEWRRGSLLLERAGVARGGARLGERIEAVAGDARLRGVVIAPRRARLEVMP
jgi:flagella basal body P-ring formation protein FlgA